MKILLIEDNPGDSRLIQEILKEAGGSFSFNVAEKLGLGLKFLLTQSVDVVLLDLNLPDSRGLETLTKLQTQFSNLPIVILTTLDDEALGTQAVQLGAQDYLVKGNVDCSLLRRSLLYAIERKKIDEALKEKDQFLEHLAELNPAVISVIDLTNNRFLYSSRPMSERLDRLGYKPEEIEDANCFSASILYPGDLERMEAAAAGLKQANDDRVRDIEVRVKAANGRWHWLQVLYVVFKRDHNGLPIQSMSVTRDITERKEAEEALRQRTADLEAVNKELEAFSYSVSHDLQAPLRRINSYIQLMVENHSDRPDAQRKEYLQRIRSSSQLMQQLIDDMLRLSRIGRAELTVENINLSELAQSIAEELKRTQPERKTEFMISPGIISQGDQSLLRILLQNLLENAWKYTSKAEEARIEFGLTHQNGEEAFFIKDNGVGFDMENANRLFQPFQRLHPKKEFSGTGIGLAIAQRIINRHRGRIWAEGKVGIGATFYFTLQQNLSLPVDS